MKARILTLLTTLLLALAHGPAAYALDATYRVDQRALFRVVGAMYDLDPELLEAVAHVESAGRSDAVSPKGAVGLMQLMPATAARFRVDNPRDPVENVLGAARYLDFLRKAMLGNDHKEARDLSDVLAAYNAGEAAVWRYSGIPPFPETQDYVGRVLLVYLLGSLPQTATPGSSSARHRVGKHVASHSAAKVQTLTTLDALQAIRRERAAAEASAIAQQHE